jgi:NADH-quinone oxidoreductase subunit E
VSTRRFAETQPASFAFTPENLAWAKEQLKKYPEGREMSAILPLLWRAQEQAGGWLPRPAVEYVARMLGMAKIRAYEIATFYTMFNLEPTGKHHVQVCTTTPCWLRGSEAVVAACQRVMGTKEGEVSDDGLFSFVEVECLGACVNAPVVQIGKDYYEDLDGERMEHILRTLKDGRQPKPGPQVHRHNSAPVGEPTTLTDPSLYGGKAS